MLRNLFSLQEKITQKGGVEHLALYFLVFECHFLPLGMIHTDIPRQWCEHKMTFVFVLVLHGKGCLGTIYIATLCLLVPGK